MKNKRRPLFLLLAMAASLSMIMLMTAISFAAGNVVGFGDVTDLTAEVALEVGSTAEIKAAEGMSILGVELNNEGDADAISLDETSYIVTAKRLVKQRSMSLLRVADMAKLH